MGSSAQNSSGVHWCRRRVRFNDIPEKVPKVGTLRCRTRSRSTGFWRRFRRRFWGRSGRLWCRARSSSTRFRRRFRRRSGRLCAEPWFNRVPEKVMEKVWEALVQSQVRFNRVPEKVPKKVWEAQARFNRICGHLIHGSPVEVFPALGFAARFRKICKNKTLRLLGIPPKLISFSFLSLMDMDT